MISNSRDVLPGISVIHPVKGVDYEFEKNIKSWVDQDYKGPVEHIFSFQEEADPAMAIVKELKNCCPLSDIQITVNAVINGLSGKSSNMVYGLKLAKYEFIIFADSDTRVDRGLVSKMVRIVQDGSVGAVACPQRIIGGRDFWTRFFTYFQNSGINFVWAFCTYFRVDMGIAGAAFVMRKEVIKKIGGLEIFGKSLSEDYYLGKALVKNGYKIMVGPFTEGYVDKVNKTGVINCLKRSAAGVMLCGPFKALQFTFFLGWYWLILVWAVIAREPGLVYLSAFIVIVRIITGLMQRIITKNKVMPIDIIIPLFSDLAEMISIISVWRIKNVVWRGIKYEIKQGGGIKSSSTIV